MLATLVLFLVIWWLHPTTEKVDARSLPFTVACSCADEGLVTPILTEDKLKSEPIKPKTVETEDDSQDDSEKETKTGEKQQTETTRTRQYPTPDKEQIIDDDFIWDEEVDDPVVDDTQGDGDNINVPLVGTTPAVEITTERDADIPSTVTTPGESQVIGDGALKVEIIRKY
jgi:hypothetical protein